MTLIHPETSEDMRTKGMRAKGVHFPMPPTKQDFGGMLAQFEDSEGAFVSVGAS